MTVDSHKGPTGSASLADALSIRDAASSHGDAPAVMTEQHVFSFADMHAASEKVAEYLEEQGAAQAAQVSIEAPRTIATLATIYACLERGWTLHLHEGHHEGGDSPGLSCGQAALSEAATRPLGTELLPKPVSHPSPAVETETFALNTSGSTAKPKRILLRRANILSAAESSAKHIGWLKRDRWLLALPLHHAGGLSIITRCLVARRPIVLYPETSFEAERVTSLMERHHATLASLVPTMVHRLLGLKSFAPMRDLRAVLVGGAPFEVELQRECVARGLIALRTYGMTETFGQVCTQHLSEALEARPGVGKALVGNALRLARDGTLEIRSPSCALHMMDGDKRIPLQKQGWLATRDRAHIDSDGTVHIRGRSDDTIISGGENVHLGELEQRLQSALGTKDLALATVPDDTWGQSIAALSTDARVLCDLRQALQSGVLSLKPAERPKHMKHVPALPRTALGKPARAALNALAARSVEERPPKQPGP